MSTPSISVSVHDAYTPEIRDRILERLRASMEDTTYAVLTPAHLRALAAIDSPGAPVLSLYLQLSPDRRASGALEAISRYCPGCGSNAVEAVEDVVEMAIEQALEQRAALELVRSGAARRLMSERGPMAALLRG